MKRRCFTILAASLLAAGAEADLFVPAGLNPGDKYHLAFVSSTTRDASSPNIGDYDDHVQAAADASGIGSSEGVTWSVIASTAAVHARNHAVVSAPVYLLDGTKVADDFTDMWDGDIDAAISLHEDGTSTIVAGSRVFTGSLDSGFVTGEPLGTAGAWVGGGNPNATGPDGPGTSGNWMDANMTPPKATLRSFYALSEELTVPASSSLKLVDLSYDPDTGAAEASIRGVANTNYKLTLDDDVDLGFDPRSTIPLDSATVGTLQPNDKVQTDGDGNATVQFNLGPAAGTSYLRAETP